jgi:hypothetical protein
VLYPVFPSDGNEMRMSFWRRTTSCEGISILLT